jgi:NADPH:quinone reductase-like Zn-dependent oxidoreductase
LKPANVTHEQAATVPTSAFTALQALRDKGKTEPGQKVLIIGASGGVGTFAVQIAKSFGAEVTGVCSTPKVDMVRSLGADHVIDYTREDIAETGQRYDLIVDTGGNRSLSHLRSALTPTGTLVMVGSTGGPWLNGIGRTFRASLLSPFVSQRMPFFISSRNKEDLVVLKELLETGKITPAMDRTYSLSDVPEAFRYFGDGHAKGKIAITVATAD